MPDITMCTNSECDKRSECYRFMAVPSTRQSVIHGCTDDRLFLEIDGRRVREIGNEDKTD